MAKKVITCIYQDCPFCGQRGKMVKQLVAEGKANVRKVSFASAEGQHLIHEAVFGGYKVEFPLFTDGVEFSTDITDFTKRKAKTTKKSKRITTTEVIKKNGANK